MSVKARKSVSNRSNKQLFCLKLKAQYKHTQKKNPPKVSPPPSSKEKWIWTRLHSSESRAKQTQSSQYILKESSRHSSTELKTVNFNTRGALSKGNQTEYASRCRMCPNIFICKLPFSWSIIIVIQKYLFVSSVNSSWHSDVGLLLTKED